MTRNISFLILYFIFNCCYAQDLDQLYKEAVESSDLELASKVNILALQQENEQVVANSYYLIAYLQKKEDDFFNAVINYMEAAKHYREIGDFNNLAGVVENLGNIYKESGFKSAGLKYYYDALTLNEQLQDTLGVMFIHYNIGQLFNDIDKPDTALMNYHKALSIAKKLRSNFVGRIYNDIGICHSSIESYDVARKYYDSVDISDASIVTRARILNNRGYSYLRQKDTIQASKYFKEVLELDLNEVEDRTLSYVYGNLGNTQKSPDLMIKYYEASFLYLEDKAMTMSSKYYSTCKELEKLYRVTGEEQCALYYDHLQDIFTEELIELQDKLQSENLQYQVEAATWKLESELRMRDQILLYVVAALLLALIGVVIFYRRTYEARKKEGSILIQARELKEKLSS